MKKIFSLLALAVTLVGCGGSSGVALQDAETFKATVAKPGVVVLDVRTPAEFIDGHIPNAINIDVEDSTFEQRIASLDKTVEYAVYCRSGRRSAIATDLMSKSGFTKLSDLDGGIQTWTGQIQIP